MKKTMCLVALFGLMVGNASSGTVDGGALAMSLMNIASQLLLNIPKLIKDIPAFPEKIKGTMTEFKTGYKAVLKMPNATEAEKKLKDKELQRLFVLGVSLLIDVNNISDKILGIVKEIGPVVKAIDEKVGPKVDMVITDIVDIIFMFSRIAGGVQRILLEDKEKGFTKPADQAPIAKSVIVSDDL